MRHSHFISSTPLIAGLLTGLLFAILVVRLNADDSHSWYDVSKEVTLSGTVSSVLHKPAPGMIWGSHLIVETAFGRLDASPAASKQSKISDSNAFKGSPLTSASGVPAGRSVFHLTSPLIGLLALELLQKVFLRAKLSYLVSGLPANMRHLHQVES